jgi:hypothetical protein
MELLVARFCSLCYRNRQSEMKGCTRAKVGAGPEATAVRFDKRPADCQTHPRALRLSSEERIEYSVRVFGKSLPRVPNHNRDFTA